MFARSYSIASLALIASFSLVSSPSFGAEAEAFYQACYLQAEQRDFAAAAELFAQVAEGKEAPAEIREVARKRLAECREELAAADLASLMPGDAILYVQVANIGRQTTTLLESLGVADSADPRDGAAGRIPIEPGLSIPVDIGVSPALVREIGKLGGVAAAITGVDGRGVPQGVAVVHLGDSDLVRGLVETGLQVVTPSDAIGDYATYLLPAEGETLWMVQTERLLVFSNSRDQAAAAVGRIDASPEGESLQDSAAFREGAEKRGESLFFAWADSQRAAPMVDAMMVEELQGEELIAARAALGLQSIEDATLAIGVVPGGLRGEATIRFKPGHQHLLYALIRTAPIGEDAFRRVPPGAAAVASIGLNPPTVGGEKESGEPRPLALMDIGRELFANVRSVSLFVMPSERPVPEVGLVVYAQDGAKSKELWSRLLALPSQFGAIPAESVKEAEIAGHGVTEYSYPDAPPIFVASGSDESMVVGTGGAVEASLATLSGGESLGGHADGARLLESAGPATSKALFLRGGRLMKVAEPSVSAHEREQFAKVAPLINDLTASLTVGEEPNQLSVRLDVVGIPKVGDLLRALNGNGPRTHPAIPLQSAATP